MVQRAGDATNPVTFFTDQLQEPPTSSPDPLECKEEERYTTRAAGYTLVPESLPDILDT